MKRPLVVLGDTLLDRDLEGTVDRLAPDAPVPVVDEATTSSRPGGAGLAAALAAMDGHDVVLVTALGSDPAGLEVSRLLSGFGVEVVDLGTTGSTSEKIRIQARGRALLRLDRGSSGPGVIGPVSAAARDAVRSACALLVSDYGRGMTAHPELRHLIADLDPSHPVVWDPHPRGELPTPGCRVVTPNLSEALALVGEPSNRWASVERCAKQLLHQWESGGVAVTMGDQGAVFYDGGPHPMVVPAPQVSTGDTCGAGDRFAAALAGSLAGGSIPSEAVATAVAEATRFVAAGGAASVRSDKPLPPAARRLERAVDLAARVRRDGGTVVATGGCFDLIHPGHVALLEAAKSLGDCLIVLLNSDASVRRLKGAGRPVNRCADRVQVLEALASVDAVEVFEEDTPTEALRRIRPDVWAKGGDYGSTRLPEAEVLHGWGGRVMILPYIRGHSTTTILERAAG